MPSHCKPPIVSSNKNQAHMMAKPGAVMFNSEMARSDTYRWL